MVVCRRDGTVADGKNPLQVWLLPFVEPHSLKQGALSAPGARCILHPVPFIPSCICNSPPLRDAHLSANWLLPMVCLAPWCVSHQSSAWRVKSLPWAMTWPRVQQFLCPQSRFLSNKSISSTNLFLCPFLFIISPYFFFYSPSLLSLTFYFPLTHTDLFTISPFPQEQVFCTYFSLYSSWQSRRKRAFFHGNQCTPCLG